MIRVIITLLFLLFPSFSHASTCFAKNDFGSNRKIVVKANPDESTIFQVSTLIRSNPKHKQIAPWVNSGFSTKASYNGESNKLTIYVDGAWSPWGGNPDYINKICPLVACNTSKSADAPCYEGGMVIKPDPNRDNFPCKLTNGWGLYGLIAIENNGKYADPNNPIYAESLPSDLFRTFRITLDENTKSKSDFGDGGFFELVFSKQCRASSNSNVICVTDKTKDGVDTVATGRLYFKILDSYYQDNSGEYNIRIIGGATKEKGLVQQIIEELRNVMLGVAQEMFEGITGNNLFKADLRALLVLYVAISAFLFMIGMLRIHQSELVIRLLKIGIIVALISPTAWEFFNNYLFDLIINGGLEIANIVTEAAFEYSFTYDNASFVLSETNQALSLYDAVLAMLLSPAIHAKVWGLLFYKWYFVYIIFFYIIFVIMILAIVKSVTMYVVSFVLLAILIVISPLFIPMILFRFTKQLFDAWLKQLVANSIMMVVIAVSLALMMSLITTEIQKMLLYKVCWQSIFSLTLFIPFSSPSEYVTAIDFYFFHPSDSHELDSSITVDNFFSFLMVAFIFKGFMDKIPQLIDALSNAGLRPVSGLTSGVIRAFEGSAIYRGASRAVNAVMSFTRPTTAAMVASKGLQKGMAQANQKFNQMEHGLQTKLQEDPSKITTNVVESSFKDSRAKLGSTISSVKEGIKPTNVIKGIFSNNDDDK